MLLLLSIFQWGAFYPEHKREWLTKAFLWKEVAAAREAEEGAFVKFTFPLFKWMAARRRDVVGTFAIPFLGFYATTSFQLSVSSKRTLFVLNKLLLGLQEGRMQPPG